MNADNRLCLSCARIRLQGLTPRPCPRCITINMSPGTLVRASIQRIAASLIKEDALKNN